MKRGTLSKTIRFEIFKRDSFTCQYCGAVAPNVLLHVDHIKPVAHGGSDDLTNLVTSCEPCNLGKGARILSENTAVEKSRRQLEELQERREQLELMMEWQSSLADLQGDLETELVDLWAVKTKKFSLTPTGRQSLGKLIRKFSAPAVMAGMEIAAASYLKLDQDGLPDKESVELAFSKIGGICEIDRRSKDKPYLKDLYYLRAVLAKRLTYCPKWDALRLLEKAHLSGVPIDNLRDIVLDSYSWSKFTEAIEEVSK